MKILFVLAIAVFSLNIFAQQVGNGQDVNGDSFLSASSEVLNEGITRNQDKLNVISRAMDYKVIAIDVNLDSIKEPLLLTAENLAFVIRTNPQGYLASYDLKNMIAEYCIFKKNDDRAGDFFIERRNWQSLDKQLKLFAAGYCQANNNPELSVEDSNDIAYYLVRLVNEILK